MSIDIDVMRLSARRPSGVESANNQRRSTNAAKFLSDDLKPTSWSALLMPSGTLSAMTVTLVPSGAVSNDHVIVICSAKAGSLDSNWTDS